MKLLELSIKGFGKFHDRRIVFGDGLNIVYGKNEAGKSTIHTFIRGMFFGIEKQRGRASRNDLYNKYEPWENQGVYEGKLRLEYEGHIYRIERTFQKNNKGLHVIDETAGKEILPAQSFLDQILGGLSETSYNNTISIGQLKSATDAGMVTELKNYIANMNTSGNMALNITKASAYLKSEKKKLENQLSPEATRSYTSLLSEIRNLEREISSPEYSNQLIAYEKRQAEIQQEITERQSNKDALLESYYKGKTALDQYDFTSQDSISSCLHHAQDMHRKVKEDQREVTRSSRKKQFTFSIVILVCALISAGYFAASALGLPAASMRLLVPIASWGAAALSILLFFICLFTALKLRNVQHEWNAKLASDQKILSDILKLHLGNAEISDAAMEAFTKRMEEFSRLCSSVEQSGRELRDKIQELSALETEKTNCGTVLEEQKRNQWELEKKLEYLADCKNRVETLRQVITENDRIREEIDAIELASETMTELSTSIRDSFGLYLNKTASELISGITGGIYNSMSVGENLNVMLNTRDRLIPIEQVSSGTMDQIYLALRLATAKLIQNGQEDLPLLFDDSFVQYDEERLETALLWLVKAYTGQLIVFTCHTREREILDRNEVEYHLVEI